MRKTGKMVGGRFSGLGQKRVLLQDQASGRPSKAGRWYSTVKNASETRASCLIREIENLFPKVVNKVRVKNRTVLHAVQSGREDKVRQVQWENPE
jgi:hypothetical protein